MWSLPNEANIAEPGQGKPNLYKEYQLVSQQHSDKLSLRQRLPNEVNIAQPGQRKPILYKER